MGYKSGSFWQDATDRRLAELCADSTLSFRDMAEILAGEFKQRVGRNACIGRAHRLNIDRPISTRQITRTAPYKPRIRLYNGHARLFKAEEVTPAKLRVVDVVPQNVSLIDTAHDGCRYPYGDGPITFCNHPSLKGFSYCGPHKALCWKPPEARAPRRARFWEAA